MRLIFAADDAAGAGEILGDPAPLDRRISPSDPPDPAADWLIGALASLYAYPKTRSGLPWVRANMVASADGAATLGGRSGGLSGPADRVLFGVLRSLADVILVGARTVRAERYRPASPAATWPQFRQDRPPLPRIAVITRSLALDPSLPLLSPAPDQPKAIVITTESAPAVRLAEVREHAEVLVAGEKDVDLPAALAALARRGYQQILTEGGPTLLGQLAAAGHLNDLCLTISPQLEGGYSPRIMNPAGPDTSPSQANSLTLQTVLEHEGSLLCRYLVASARETGGQSGSLAQPVQGLGQDGGPVPI